MNDKTKSNANSPLNLHKQGGAPVAKKLTLGGGSALNNFALSHEDDGTNSEGNEREPKRLRGQDTPSFKSSAARHKPVMIEVKRNRTLKKEVTPSPALTSLVTKPAQRPELKRNTNMVADNPLAGLTENERLTRVKVLEAAQKAAHEAEIRKAEEEAIRLQQEAERIAAEKEQKAIEAANAAELAAETKNEAAPVKSDDVAIPEIKSVVEEIVPFDPSPNLTIQRPVPPSLQRPSHGITSAGPSRAALREIAIAEQKVNKEPDLIAVVPTPKTANEKLLADKLRDDKGGRAALLDDDGAGDLDRTGKRHKTPSRSKGEPKRREGKLTISRALVEDDNDTVERGRSLAALKRAREREKQRNKDQGRTDKVIRDVIVPEAISVSDLANRMAERGADVVKSLIKMGVMATINQTIDGDTAEIIVEEFGHRVKRVNESAVEEALQIDTLSDEVGVEVPRAPVVTIMGHVDHGKTSLLDAYREANVVAGEAGGITQHIGAYRVMMKDGFQITFLDTPGHAAFTAMRQRGANATDIVILVVAADDGIKPQTAEAISHAKAAGAPIIVAINKMDKPSANPEKVRNELLSHDLVPDSMGGDVQCVEISALKRQNLDGLLEAIKYQAELMELTAVADSEARGIVVEAKQVVGRGAVATILVKAGTLHVGDIFVAGQEWGRVKAMNSENGAKVKSAGPSDPVEVLGFQNAPQAGDDFIVISDESKAREIANYRQSKNREVQLGTFGQTSLEQMFAKIKGGETKELPIVIKADVQGSVEAITHALKKLGSDEVKVRVLHSGVGPISESDISLATTSSGVVFGFNVRANPQARDQAKRDGIDIRYYSIIYNILDDVEGLLNGMLSPTITEKVLGYADIREIFDITKVGKIAGCRVTEGEVQRGAKVRLLRGDVVIYEGSLKQLKRHKDDAKEVKSGFECGISLDNFEDMQVGDKIECFVLVETARTL